MTKGLAVSDVISVSVTLTPVAVAFRNFGAMMVLGSTDGAIDVSERLRQYSDIGGVANDFSTTDPEYLAAQLFFSQSPQPNTLYIGRWAQSATKGVLHGGLLTSAQQVMSNFTVITTGSLHLSIDGVAHDITGVDFSGATNLNGVASILQTAIDLQFSSAVVKWNATYSRFNIYSGTTGASSSVSYATAAGTGVDISSLLRLQTGQALAPVAGIVAETLAQALTTLADISADWYGVGLGVASQPNDAALIAGAEVIEAQGFSRILAVTTNEANVLTASDSSDIASQLKALSLSRTLVQYSSSNAYAGMSILGRIATVNFGGSNTMLTVMFKQEPGVVAETLTETQAAAAKAKNCNIFVNYNNGKAIIQPGVMANGYYIDERHAADWFQNFLQTNLWNLLYTSPTKIPQTDAGNNQLVNVIESSCVQARQNGWVAPGVWNSPGFGQLAQFDELLTGYYVYAPPVATQAQADREARKSVPFQVAVKLAGAIHSVDCAVTVNR